MPVVGRPPKPQGQAINRAKAVHDWIEVEDVAYAGQRPDLPAGRVVDGEFRPLSALTLAWWESVSTLPHCKLWTSGDWAFALASCIVADVAFAGGIGAATELRNREKVMGTTVDFRRALRIRYVEPKHVRLAEVTEIDDYRDL